MTPPRRVPFSWRASVAEAQRRLELPPEHPLTRRHPPEGALVVAFAVPLDLTPPTNATRDRPKWWHAKQKKDLFAAMAAPFLESRLRRGVALPGRPQVRCVRFSSQAPDPCADWAKMAVDRLILPLREWRKGKLVDCKRFGILDDDDLESIDEHQWWEPAPAGKGFAYIEIRSGICVD